MLPRNCPAQGSARDVTTALPLRPAAFSVLGLTVETSQDPQQTDPTQAASGSGDAPAPKSLGSTVQSTKPSNAPGPQDITPPQNNGSQESGTASLTGTVVDKAGAAVEGAHVTLAGQAGPASRAVESGNNGQFEFTGLPADVYKLTVTAAGMITFTSRPIPLHAGESRILSPVALLVSPVTTRVVVNAGTNPELSEEQLHIAVHQRVVGVIPNFYSSYNWNAPPMLAKQKFQLSLRSMFDPVSLLSVAGIAGAEQYENIFPEYGAGIEGYGKRYGAALANHVSGNLLGRAVFPSLFHQDPRYFYKGEGSIKSRVLYALSATVVARGDNGQRQPNYSFILGHFSAAALSNLYYPASQRGASLVALNGFAGIGGDAVSNLIREFLLKRFTSHVPKGVNGEP